MVIEDLYITFKEALDMGGTLLTIDINTGLLIELDYCKNEYNILEEFKSDAFKGKAVISIIKQEDSIWLIFSNAAEIVNINLKSKDYVMYVLSDNNYRYKAAFLVDGDIWVFPEDNSNPIFIFNTYTKGIINNLYYNSENEGKLSKIIKNEEGFWFLIEHKNSIYRLDYRTKEIQEFNVSNIFELESLSYSEGEFWLSFYNSNYVAHWNPSENDTCNDYINISHIKRYKNMARIENIITYNNKLFCIPTHDKKMSVYDIQSKIETYIELPGNKRKYWLYYYGYNTLPDDRLVLYPFGREGITEINLKTLQLDFHSYKLDIFYALRNKLFPKLIDELEMGSNVKDLIRILV